MSGKYGRRRLSAFRQFKLSKLSEVKIRHSAFAPTTSLARRDLKVFLGKLGALHLFAHPSRQRTAPRPLELWILPASIARHNLAMHGILPNRRAADHSQLLLQLLSPRG